MWKKQLLEPRWRFEDIVSRSKVTQLNKILPYETLSEEVLPVSYHFMYLTPSSTTKDLDSDGYDSYQSPPEFKRRLWVGGSIEQCRPILYNSKIILYERVKSIRQFNDSLLVEIERSITNRDGDHLLKEIRRLMYLNSTHSVISPKFEKQKPEFSDVVKFEQLDLFRYSALTYNSHKIHYDRDYATKTEMYPDLLIHGPLLATLCVNFMMHNVPKVSINRIVYKNIQPLLLKDELVLNLIKQKDGRHYVWITNAKNELCCSSIIS